MDISAKLKKPELLEAGMNSLSNSAFYEISERIRKEVGLPVSERVFPEWKDWFEKIARKI